MEVLISTFVLSVGLLGFAVLLPVGQITIMETMKADRAGDCGRAALNEIKVRRMLDCNNWAWTPTSGTANMFGPIGSNGYTGGFFKTFQGPTTGATPPYQPSFLIDPLCWNALLKVTGGTNTLGLGSIPPSTGSWLYKMNQSARVVPRLTLIDPLTLQAIDANTFFYWPDDLILQMPEQMSPPRPRGRPVILQSSGTGASDPGRTMRNVAKGDYSWFATVTPLVSDMGITPSQRTRYSVSVVVCYKRNLPVDATTPFERAVQVAAPNTYQGGFLDAPGGTNVKTATGATGLPNIAYGGGTVQLLDPINDDPSDPNQPPLVNGKPAPVGINLKEDDWVALVSAATGLCSWYRVIGVGNIPLNTKTNSYPTLTLYGPDWAPTGAGNDYVVALGQSVVGVYTSVIELDQDQTWRNPP
jgi:hypothetical protein